MNFNSDKTEVLLVEWLVQFLELVVHQGTSVCSLGVLVPGLQLWSDWHWQGPGVHLTLFCWIKRIVPQLPMSWLNSRF